MLKIWKRWAAAFSEWAKAYEILEVEQMEFV